MYINVIASGSKGNATVITDGKTSLLLDAGVGIQSIREAVNFNTAGIDACLITHEHRDHSRACRDLARMGIDIYASAGTFEAVGITEGHRYKVVKARTAFSVGSFVIMPLDVKHDAEEPLCYVIYNPLTGNKLLYVVDTAYIEYNIKGLTHIITECNHGTDELLESVWNGTINQDLARRITKNHMSIERLILFLDICDRSQLQEIHLIHLSDNNSNEQKFKKLVQQATGIPVYVH